MSELTEFLLARIADDEAAAWAADPGPWKGDTSVAGDSVVFDRDGEWVTNVSGREVFRNAVAFDQSVENTTHIARHDPARVLAECEAKRRLIDEMDEADGLVHQLHDVGDYGVVMEEDLISWRLLRYLALPYASHPDYDERWRP